MKSETFPPNLMTGLLWYAEEMPDGSDSPMSLKEFKESIWRDEPFGILSKGKIILNNESKKQELIFDCIQPEKEETSTFKLILNEDGTILGKNEFPLYEGDLVEYFRGDYKIINTKISIWGVMTDDIEFEENLQSIYIELKKKLNKDEELEYNQDDAVKFIREIIPFELNEKLADEDIVKLLDLEEEYGEMEHQKHEKMSPKLSIEVTIDQDKANDYVFTNANQHNIIINEEETVEILDAHLEYLLDVGIAEDNNLYFHDN